MGGNIGRAVLSLDELSNDRIYVVECSSYQIDLAPQLDPSIGILLNLAPDHLDRHGTMEHYSEIKSRLVAKSTTSIIGNDDAHCVDIASRLEQSGKSITRISNQNLNSGYGVLDEQVVRFNSGDENFVANLHGIATLRGRHNAQNAAAAIATCRAGWIKAQMRMQAAMALASFENIHWIAGGLSKEGGIESLRPLFGRINKAYLIGEAAPEFSVTLGNDVVFEISQTLDVAVANAANDAEQSKDKAVVMLSPACASFDQYPNFEIRGEAFRTEVEKLDNLIPYGGI
ncbi:UDP-N-acetylmuramoylalanine--D-glutamate ligase [Nymphon striatum]|nr:UDP-N-acetylmuramoylalanine--D-glutamate ligase [Nymphon striatum]